MAYPVEPCADNLPCGGTQSGAESFRILAQPLDRDRCLAEFARVADQPVLDTVGIGFQVELQAEDFVTQAEGLVGARRYSRASGRPPAR
ncbi:hypothetical protein ACTMU2_15125 [Cupriavidus basilensis]